MDGGGFTDIGAHCSVASCNLQDFLPFTCAGCQQQFCLEHHTPKAHACPQHDATGAHARHGFLFPNNAHCAASRTIGCC